ncbi:MAG: ammonium transporter [Dysgonamonadaceae bacterium]|jgi:Amt family ammonium transporter|nr:ammonium transporter [Dysgonamonadaceae bacterium]
MEENILTTVGDLAQSLDTVWVLLGAMLVFWMQPGFALVESGFTRSKNSANILMKNFVDFSIGSLLYWIIGFGIMFGAGNGFFGEIDLFGVAGWEGDIPTSAFLVFQTMFAATAATIVSGAMAERTKFHVYACYSIIICIFIYPISGHWGWSSTGWLAGLGFHDFAGSTLVHAVGGFLACAGAWILGPRTGKYTKEGKVKAIPGHNLTIAALGVFILWLGWFGFNPGSTLAASGEAKTAISGIFLTTNLSAAAGAVAAIITSYFLYKKPSLSLMLNGVLAGLVGITAGCDIVSPSGAAVIGLLSGAVMVLSVSLFDRIFKIDDPVGAISVHGVCGILGTLLVGLFATDGGLFYGGGFSMLGIQALGTFTVSVWALVTGFILFKVLDLTLGLRVSKRVEEEGLDIYEHGETTYN